MARVVEFQSDGDFVWFVPRAGGERDAYDEWREQSDEAAREGRQAPVEVKPLAIQIRAMSAAEFQRQNMRAMTNKQMQRIARGRNDAAVEVATNLFARCVGKVINYRVGGRDITTGRELHEHGEDVITAEVLEAIRDLSLLSDGARKLSASPLP